MRMLIGICSSNLKKAVEPNRIEISDKGGLHINDNIFGLSFALNVKLTFLIRLH